MPSDHTGLPVPEPVSDERALVRAVEESVGAVRRALERALDALGEPMVNASDLRRRLGIDTRLATQVYRVAGEGDARSVAVDMPGPPSMARLLGSLERAGVSAPLREDVRQAASSFERLIVERAGDRKRFESLLANLGARGPEHVERQHRRAAYRAMSHLLGMQVGAYLRCAVIARSAQRGIDMLQVRGFDAVTRLRPSVPIPLFAARMLTSAGTVMPETVARGHVCGRALVGASNDDLSVGLLHASRPDSLEWLRVVPELGMHAVEWLGPGLGTQGATNLHFVHADFGVPVHTSMELENVGINHSMALPAERFVLDVLCERGLLGGAPSVGVFINRTGRVAMTYRTEDRLPITPSVKSLRGLGALERACTWPGWFDSINMALSAIGWQDRKWTMHRVTIDYPILETFVRTGLKLTT
jgi:hypothetical protein